MTSLANNEADNILSIEQNPKFSNTIAKRFFYEFKILTRMSF